MPPGLANAVDRTPHCRRRRYQFRRYIGIQCGGGVVVVVGYYVVDDTSANSLVCTRTTFMSVDVVGYDTIMTQYHERWGEESVVMCRDARRVHFHRPPSFARRIDRRADRKGVRRTASPATPRCMLLLCFCFVFFSYPCTHSCSDVVVVIDPPDKTHSTHIHVS